MITAPQFADAVGRKKIAEAMNVGMTAVSNAVVRERFPSSWYETCEVLAAEAGIEFPKYLFSQKGSHASRCVEINAPVQEAGA